MLDHLLSLAVRFLDGAEKFEPFIQTHWSQRVLGEHFLGLLDLARQVRNELDRSEAEQVDLDKLTLSHLHGVHLQKAFCRPDFAGRVSHIEEQLPTQRVNVLE